MFLGKKFCRPWNASQVHLKVTSDFHWKKTGSCLFWAPDFILKCAEAHMQLPLSSEFLWTWLELSSCQVRSVGPLGKPPIWTSMEVPGTEYLRIIRAHCTIVLSLSYSPHHQHFSRGFCTPPVRILMDVYRAISWAHAGQWRAQWIDESGRKVFPSGQTFETSAGRHRESREGRGRRRIGSKHKLQCRKPIQGFLLCL